MFSFEDDISYFKKNMISLELGLGDSLGCSRERFLAITSGCYTQYIKKLELSGVNLTIKFLHDRVL